MKQSNYLRGSARAEVPARTALVGNPSDAFGGATISLALEELRATVAVEPALGMGLEADGGTLEFDDLAALVDAGRRSEYPATGPLALLMAATKRYAEPRAALGESGLRIEVVESSIPPGVGLAGSSAIVIGALRALGALFGDEIPDKDLPATALACETEELGISGGLQDRVVQTLGGLVFMDFDPALPGGGRFEPLDPAPLPALFVAWLPEAPTDSGDVHRDVLARFRAGDREVVEAIAEIGALPQRALTPLLMGDGAGLGVLMERNLELRRHIYALDPRHVELADAARELGAPVNYAGSGGAIVGLFRDDEHLAELREGLGVLGCDLLVRRGREPVA